MKKKKILVLGQTPPPYGGQALMLQTLLEGQYEHAELFHVRLDFSKDFNDMGSFKLYKLWALIKAILLTWTYRFRYNIDIFYYGPAGPNKMAMLRDVILLAPTRFLFKKTIIHTHAGGSSRLYDGLSPLLKFFYRAAFFKPSVLITLTDYSHGDDIVLQPEKLFVVPNGIKDEYPLYEKHCAPSADGLTTFLYVGAMYEERGTGILIEAARILKQKGYNFRINLVGIFISAEYKAQLTNFVKEYKLENEVSFLGTRINEAKWKEYCNADVFCFPTYVPSETFGIVLVEAMQFRMPVIASRWNGIPFVVDENENALLTEPQNTQDTVEKMELLINDHHLRQQLGENGRKKFLEKYSIETFLKNMDKVFAEV
ncbi:glycosyltransferase family 4 protein [Mucilaginibacter panaciglaebae]|uniref:Glycosyl transferase family 1 domain-containing protein n=1 Tax=Mucilaginibacter panaciglaebae TaxID=502331 RepID=A0ABP7WNK6_9SPHI